jgi:nucleoside phosphorylase
MNITKCIITALQMEADLIIKKYDLKEDKNVWSLKLFTWERKTHEDEHENIVLAVCGEGKIHSAFATSYLCENYDFQKIVNIWIAWNLNPDILAIWDVILPNTFMQHDFYMPKEIDFSSHLRETIFLEYAIGQEYNLEKFSLHLSGICATGDQFVDNADLQSEIHEHYGADVVDMEAYAILSVLKNYHRLDRAVVIKSVSDGADEQSAKNSMENLELAMQNAVNILEFTL